MKRRYAPLILTFALAGCGGGSPYSPQSVAVGGAGPTPPPSGGIDQPDFGIALQAPATVVFPNDVAFSIKATSTPKFAGTVALAVPNAATSGVTLSSASVTPTVAGASVPATYSFPALDAFPDDSGSLRLNVNGTGSSGFRGAFATVKVSTFGLTVANDPLDTNDKATLRHFTLHLKSVNGFAGTLSLRSILTTLPAGAVVAGLPASVTLAATDTDLALPFTLQLGGLPSAFNQTFQVAAGIGGKERAVDARFNFRPEVAFTAVVTQADPANTGVVQSFNVLVTPTGGFSGRVDLRAVIASSPDSTASPVPQATTFTGVPVTLNFGLSQSPQTLKITATLPANAPAKFYQFYLQADGSNGSEASQFVDVIVGAPG